MGTQQFVLSLVIILLAAKIAAEIAERRKQPAVLGELIAGIVIGGGVLGPLSEHVHFLRPFVIHPNDLTLQSIGQLGAILLLFEAGLESDIHELRRLGGAALWVASVGVIVSITLGFTAAHLLGIGELPAVFIGGALASTSVGITARTFGDLGKSRTTEAKTVMGAAIADDVMGLVVLAVITGLVGSKAVTVWSLVKITGVAIAFLVGAIFIGVKCAPVILRLAEKMRTRAALSSAALAFCLILATIAGTVAQLSPIIGAFAAGLVLAQTEHKLHIEQKVKAVADIFIPVFFVLMGAAMPLSALNPTTASGRETIALAAILSVVAIIAKLCAGMSIPVRRINRVIVGTGMIPRGEVTLIFASYGIRSLVISGQIYSALLIVVMVTTFVTPLLLKVVMHKKSADRTIGDSIDSGTDRQTASPEADGQIAFSTATKF